MDSQFTYLLLVAVGMAFGGVFFPIVRRRWLSLVSVYLKADLRKRALSIVVDAGICTTLFVLLIPQGLIVASALSPLYLLVRDCAFPGQSFGKLVAGLVVIELDSGAPIGILRSLQRNIFFVVPGFNLIAVMFESEAIWRDPQGMRLGDLFAQTQVIEGKGVMELVKLLQRRLLDDLQGWENESPGKIPRRTKHHSHQCEHRRQQTNIQEDMRRSPNHSMKRDATAPPWFLVFGRSASNLPF